MKGTTKWTGSSSGRWGNSTNAEMSFSLSLPLSLSLSSFALCDHRTTVLGRRGGFCRWLPESGGVRICMKSLLAFFWSFSPSHLLMSLGPNPWVRARVMRACTSAADGCLDICPCTVFYGGVYPYLCLCVHLYVVWSYTCFCQLSTLPEATSAAPHLHLIFSRCPRSGLRPWAAMSPP